MRRDDLDALLAEQGIMRAAVNAGIGIEAGLPTRADAQEFARSPFVHQVVRALVEVSGGAEDARAIAKLIPPRPSAVARVRRADLGGADRRRGCGR